MSKTATENVLQLIAAEPVSRPDLDAWASQEGAEVAPGSERTVRETYYDSDDHALLRRGITLAVRRAESGGSACVAWAGKQPYGRCGELTAPWEGALQVASQLPDQLRLEVEPFVLAQPLRPVVRLSTVHHDIRLSRGTGEVAEVVLGEVTIEDDGTPRGAWQEVTLEQTAGEAGSWDGLAQRLRDDPRLRVAAGTLVQEALTRLDRGVVSAEPAPIARKSLVHHAAVQTMARHFAAAQAQEPETRRDGDPEGLHQMRVAYRRLAAAARAFGALFREGQLRPLAQLLRRSRRVMGPVRDLDVMLDWLPQAETALAAVGSVPDELMARLEQQRQRRRQALLRWLTSPQRLRGCERFERLLGQLASRPRTELTVREVAPGLLLRAARRALRARGRAQGEGTPERLHELRIVLKRLRYLIEDFSQPYPGLKRFRRQLVGMQDLLGTYCDAQVAAVQLGQLVSGRPRLSSGSAAFVGAVVAQQLARQETARAEFLGASKRISRKRIYGALMEALA